jgi:hypothetical protein
MSGASHIWNARIQKVNKNTGINQFSIQPKGQFEQEPEPSQATGMALVRCILGRSLGVVCYCFPHF